MTRLLARLTTRVQLLGLAAALPLLAALFYLQADERDEELRRAVDENRRIVRLAAGRASGVIGSAERLVGTLARVDAFIQADPSACRAILRDVLAEQPALINVAVMDDRATNVCAATPVDPIRFAQNAEFPWFKQVVRDGGVVVSEPYASLTDGRLVVTVLARLESRDPASHRNVVGAALSAEAFTHSFGQADLPAGGVLALVDRTGRVVAGFPKDSVRVGLQLPIPEGALRAADRAGSQELDHPGGPLLIAPIRTAADKPAGYYAILSIDADAAMAAASARWRRYMLLIAIASAAAAAFGVFAARKLLLAPARDLADVAHRIADGHLGARLRKASGITEVGELGEAINYMADALERREAERDRAASDLAQSQERYKLLFEENPNPMWVFDAGTLRFLMVNCAAVRAYGYTREQFLSMTIADIRPACDVPELLQSVAGDERRQGRQWRHRLASGALIDVAIATSAVSFEGRPAMLVCARDVSAEHRAQRALAEAEERMRFALGASGVGVWEVNLVSGQSYWSEITEGMHGMPPGTFGATQEAFIKAIHPDDRRACTDEIRAAMHERRNAVLEYRTAATDAPKRIRSIGRFFYDEAGTPVRGAGVSIDITELRAIEERLRHAQQLEAVGQLAGGVAHDFNNLLTVIQGNAELALKASGKPVHEELEEILGAAARAAHLTRQLLSFSRKQIVHVVAVDVDDMVRKLLPMLGRLIEEDIEITYRGCASTATVLADRTELEQALINLVVNARDALRGGGAIDLAVEVIPDAPVASVAISVADNGTGMTPEVLARAFEPFYTTKPPGKGTGLGLASVYGMAKQAGGEVSITSAAGQGTRVTILLPRVEACEVVATKPAAPALPAKGTVLLVEDQDGVRSFAARVLRNAGYHVLEAENATGAVRAAADHNGDIDLLFSDVVMPGPSIVDAIDHIRSLRPSLAVLMTSGYPDREVRQRLGTLEVELLGKPYAIQDLLDRVAKAIRRRGALRPVA